MFVRNGIVAAFLFMFCVPSALAAERLGVPVYPGAKYDQDRTKLLQKSLGVKGAAYRTGDDIEMVTAFYRKQGLLFLKIGSPSRDHARFRKVETNVDVVVEKLLKDPKTGAKTGDTVILIFKKEEDGSKPDIAI